MTENVSWIQKPKVMIPRRTLQNSAESNSTLTTTLINSSTEVVFKPPKRKSCLMFQDRAKILNLPVQKKAKTNGPVKTEFRDRTIKMVQGRTSIQPLRPSTRQRSQIPTQKVLNSYIKGPPLGMSTPCEHPRSIMKNPEIRSAAKKVEFDTGDDGVSPVQESTIHDFPKNVLKLSTFKVDMATNTEEIIPKDAKNSDINLEFSDLFQKLEKNILDKIEEKMASFTTKIEEIIKNNCAGKSEFFREGQVKSIQQFMSNLDAIGEESENVTPSTREESENATSSVVEPNENLSMTPKVNDQMRPSKVGQVEEKSPENENKPEVNDINKEEGSVMGDEEKKVVNGEPDSSPTVSDSGRRRRATRASRQQRPTVPMSPADSVQSVTNRLRNVRKRHFPRHLDSFELSPRVKKS